MSLPLGEWAVGTGKAISNFAATLLAEHSDLARQATKDPYLFDFLTRRRSRSNAIWSAD